MSAVHYKSFKNSVGKGEIASYRQFLLFSQHFLPFQRTFHYFIKYIAVFCKSVSLEESKVVARERVKV